MKAGKRQREKSSCFLSTWIQLCLKPTPWTLWLWATINNLFPYGFLSWILSFAAKLQQLYPWFSCPFSFLPPGSWTQFSPVPAGEEIRVGFYSKLVALEPFGLYPSPELIRMHPELAQNVTRKKRQGTKKEKSAFQYSNELLQKERKQRAVPLKKCRSAGPRIR